MDSKVSIVVANDSRIAMESYTGLKFSSFIVPEDIIMILRDQNYTINPIEIMLK